MMDRGTLNEGTGGRYGNSYTVVMAESFDPPDWFVLAFDYEDPRVGWTVLAGPFGNSMSAWEAYRQLRGAQTEEENAELDAELAAEYEDPS